MFLHSFRMLNFIAILPFIPMFVFGQECQLGTLPCQCVSDKVYDLQSFLPRPLSTIDYATQFTYYIEPCGDVHRLSSLCSPVQAFGVKIIGCQRDKSLEFPIGTVQNAQVFGDPQQNNVCFKYEAALGNDGQKRDVYLNVRCGREGNNQGSFTFDQEWPVPPPRPGVGAGP